MENFARIINNIAVDVSRDPGNQFHPDIAAEFLAVPNEVEPGWSRDPDTSAWSAPAAPAPTEPVATLPPVVSVTQFLMLFTSPERIKAKELRAGGDTVIDDFWGLLDDPRTQNVDLSLASVQGAIEYTLAAVAAGGVDLDVAARKAQILTGVVQ